MADCVLGMSSVFLIHSHAIGKPTISIQIGRTSVSDADQIMLLEEITSLKYDDFHEELMKILQGGFSVKELSFPIDSIERTWNLLLDKE